MDKLDINLSDFESVIDNMTSSELNDYLKSLSGTIKAQTIKQNRALFLIGQKSVSTEWYDDNMTTTAHDLDKLVYESYDKYDTRTREFIKSVSTVKYALDTDEIQFSAVLKAKGYLFDGDVSKVTDVQTLIGIINDGHTQIDSIMNGSDALKPTMQAHKAHQKDLRDLSLKARLQACKKTNVELATLRLKQTIAKNVQSQHKVDNSKGADERINAYRAMYASATCATTDDTTVSNVPDVKTGFHTKIIKGVEVHAHEGLKGYHVVTQNHKNKSLHDEM